MTINSSPTSKRNSGPHTARLWTNLAAVVYKHVALEFVFLKYVSDTFDLRQELEVQLWTLSLAV